MKNLAPDITRQRLLIEGFYDIEVDKNVIKNFFQAFTGHMALKVYGEPIIFSPGGEGKEENQGYDAFIPLIDSGISLYVWSNSRFLSMIIYTCKSFDADKAVYFTKEFFKAEKIEYKEF